MINERWTGQNLEGSDHAPFDAPSDHLLDWTEKDHDKLRVFDVITEIPVGHVPRNTPGGNATPYVGVCNSRCCQSLPYRCKGLKIKAYVLTVTGDAWNSTERVANAHPRTVPVYAQPSECRRFGERTGSAVRWYQNELLTRGLGMEEW